MDPDSDSIRTNNKYPHFVTTVTLIALMLSFVVFAGARKVTFLPDLQQLKSFLAVKAKIFEVPLVGVPRTICTHLLGHVSLQRYLERHVGYVGRNTMVTCALCAKGRYHESINHAEITSFLDHVRRMPST
jgi:hypothetical protein